MSHPPPEYRKLLECERRFNATDDDRPVIAPPDTVTVHSAERPVLYDHTGRPLHRRIGFTTPRVR